MLAMSSLFCSLCVVLLLLQVRHLANVFQGLLMSTPELFNTPAKWGKLWLHESERVYADRLVTLTDLEAYAKAAVTIAKK